MHKRLVMKTLLKIIVCLLSVYIIAILLPGAAVLFAAFSAILIGAMKWLSGVLQTIPSFIMTFIIMIAASIGFLVIAFRD